MKTMKIHLKKVEVSQKFLMSNYRLVKIPFCEGQNLLMYYSPVYENCSKNFHNFDCYAVFIDGGYPVIVCTGACPIGVNVDSEMLHDFNKRAMKIHGERRESKIDDLLVKLIKDALKIGRQYEAD